MVSIAGNIDTTTNEERLDRYFTARTTAELNKMIDALAGLLSCPVKLAALPPPGQRMYSFLRSPSGDEVVLRDIREIDPTAQRKHLNDEDDFNYFNQNVFWLETSNQTMYVSKLVCNKMLEANHLVVIRTGRPRLTE